MIDMTMAVAFQRMKVNVVDVVDHVQIAILLVTMNGNEWFHLFYLAVDVNKGSGLSSLLFFSLLILLV